MSSDTVVKRILIVANKSWEADPLISVLLNPQLRPEPGFGSWVPGAQGLFSTWGGARPQGTEPCPRCIATIPGIQVEVWCIEDWLAGANHSSSKAKMTQSLPAIFNSGKTPDFVVAFGTASFPDSTTYNGCVVGGTNAYLFNSYRGTPSGVIHDPSGDWDDSSNVGQLLTSTAGSAVFGLLAGSPNSTLSINTRLTPVPSYAAATPVFIPAANYVSLSDLNITNYNDYVWADLAALKDCLAKNPTYPVGSVETTHGLIRTMSDAPFLFLSGIVNRLGYLNQEQAPRSIAQNFTAAHNAGVALAWLLPLIVQSLASLAA
ncbi:MAG: hypothetical protein PW735_06365 [Acidobacteriaceae bacterium]|nr:hypothetical protein [Acidobacteriaceae bacterium]